MGTTSPGLTGDTPVGRSRIDRKDAGHDAIGMLDALCPLRGFAVHGHRSVPPYRAGHGCARIRLRTAHGFCSRRHLGDIVFVF